MKTFIIVLFATMYAIPFVSNAQQSSPCTLESPVYLDTVWGSTAYGSTDVQLSFHSNSFEGNLRNVFYEITLFFLGKEEKQEIESYNLLKKGETDMSATRRFDFKSSWRPTGVNVTILYNDGDPNQKKIVSCSRYIKLK